jgi:hypothetical protein
VSPGGVAVVGASVGCICAASPVTDERIVRFRSKSTSFLQWTYAVKSGRPGALCTALRKMEGDYGSAPKAPARDNNATTNPPERGADATDSTASQSTSTIAVSTSKRYLLGKGGAVLLAALLLVGLT